MIGFDSFIPVFDMIEDAKHCPNSLSLKLLKRNGTSYGYMVVRDLHTNISLSQVSELLTRPRTQSERIWAWSCWTPSKQVVFANSVRRLSFQLQHLRIFFCKKYLLFECKEKDLLCKNRVKSMNVGLAPHLATSKLKILRGLCQGSRGSIHDPSAVPKVMFFNCESDTSKGICIFISSLCK